MPAIRTHTFQYDPGGHLATDGGGYRSVRLGPSNPWARDADRLAEKHDVDRRVVLGIVNFIRHEYGEAQVLHVDPRSDGVAV